MITLKILNDVIAPMVFCDACNERITDAGKGRVIHSMPDANDGGVATVFHVHLGGCDLELTEVWKRQGIELDAWQTLEEYLVNLASNSGVNVKK